MGGKSHPIYSEVADVCPIYCSGVANVHMEHGNLHIAYYREERNGEGTLERVIVLRLILPESALSAGRDLVNFEIATTRHVVGAMRAEGSA